MITDKTVTAIQKEFDRIPQKVLLRANGELNMPNIWHQTNLNDSGASQQRLSCDITLLSTHPIEVNNCCGFLDELTFSN